LIDVAWFGGLGGVRNGLVREIRGELDREPNTGDLLLALAGTPDTLAAQGLHELGVNPEALLGVIEQVRARGSSSGQAQLAQQARADAVPSAVLQQIRRHLDISGPA
jgi:hypothetical protein